MVNITNSKNKKRIKDELNGKLIIKEATFLVNKQYGYTFEDNGQIVEKSVFAGCVRDSITYEDICKLNEGLSVDSKVKQRFYKSFINQNYTPPIPGVKNKKKGIIW